MKKVILLTLLFVAAITSKATDLFVGEHHVSWDTSMKFTPEQLADLQIGNKIVFEIVGATDGFELKDMEGKRLPGCRNPHWINGDLNIETFVTPAMLAKIQEGGFEAIGNNFTVKKVWYGEGKSNVTENTLWSGFFWMDEWSTLEVAMESFEGIDWSKYKAIRFISEAGRTNYVINVLASWDGADKIADQNAMTMTNEYAELDLTTLSAGQLALFTKTEHVMIQCNKEQGDPFNFTAIELVPANPTALSTIRINEPSTTSWSLSGQPMPAHQKGIRIIGGKKVVK